MPDINAKACLQNRLTQELPNAIPEYKHTASV